MDITVFIETGHYIWVRKDTIENITIKFNYTMNDISVCLLIYCRSTNKQGVRTIVGKKLGSLSARLQVS